MKTFNEIVEARCKKIVATLASKEEEYATDENRFHNFDVAGRAENISPVQALWTMKMKHWVSILDVVKKIEKAFQEGREPEPVTVEFINQKIGDDINYDILLEGILRERYIDIPRLKVPPGIQYPATPCIHKHTASCIYTKTDPHCINISECPRYKPTPQSDQSA